MRIASHSVTPLRACLLAFLTGVLLLATEAQSEDGWHGAVFAGPVMEGPWEDTLNPSKARAAGAGLVGVALGWDRRLGATRLSYGFEAQAVAHFGRQDHFEVNLPLVLRFTPRKPLPQWFKSAAFGLGLSHATKVPQVEIDRSGASQRTFFYWMAETEFALPWEGDSAFFRLHHRSDGFGYFDENSGSTALAFGWRRRF